MLSPAIPVSCKEVCLYRSAKTAQLNEGREMWSWWAVHCSCQTIIPAHQDRLMTPSHLSWIPKYHNSPTLDLGVRI